MGGGGEKELFIDAFILRLLFMPNRLFRHLKDIYLFFLLPN